MPYHSFDPGRDRRPVSRYAATHSPMRRRIL